MRLHLLFPLLALGLAACSSTPPSITSFEVVRCNEPGSNKAVFTAQINGSFRQADIAFRDANDAIIRKPDGSYDQYEHAFSNDVTTKSATVPAGAVKAELYVYPLQSGLSALVASDQLDTFSAEGCK
ncbi:hypothetical protein HNR42_000170 [Deinobacterium chartae]|uniref:Lipoprotein n=1 Tax=Deinobacterium chartae TaxID=521158 RepID=A0A841HXV8_9DEIO|nr:hypothetical protein [Deinobacterium chartae]MBB6096758.1 hypothetical protein [Deinobacterium chartae]